MITDKTILEAYKIIATVIKSNTKVVPELERKYLLEKDDLIQEITTKFIMNCKEGKIREIKYLRAYINKFTYNALLNIKEKHSRLKRVSYEDMVNIDDIEI